MLKSICLTALLIVALTLFIAEPTFSISLPQETQSSETADTQSKEAEKANVALPECYVQTEDGKIVDLGDSCKKAPTVSGQSYAYPQPPHPYDTEAIKEFDEQLYGAGN